MSLLTWNPSYTVKVKRCDDDHKRLFALINTLHDAMSTGKGNSGVGKVVHELSDYTEYHFSAEEAILQKTKYPGLAAHQLQHREFPDHVKKFEQEVASRKGVPSDSISVFLNDWLLKHIKQTDQKYSDHVNANGIS